MTIDPEALHRWSSELCRRATLEPSEIPGLLGLPGTAVERGRDYLVIEPTPPGTSRVTIGRREGLLSHVELELTERTMTRADVERRLGPGHAIPRVAAGRPHRLMFQIERAGAVFSCALFASFAEPPTAASIVTEVLLRRDPVR
jgi:hypothetical protein